MDDIIQIKIIVKFIRIFWDLILVLLLWFRVKDKAALHLGLVFLFFGVYAGATGLMEFTEIDRLFLVRLQWVAMLAMPALFSFVYCLVHRTEYVKFKIYFWYIPSIAIVLFALTTNYFVSNGLLDHIVKACFIIIGGAGSFYYLLKGYLESHGIQKRQLKYFILAAALFIIEKVITLAVLPMYPRTNLAYFYDIADDIISFFAIFLIVYIIVSKRMFIELKAILTEILVGAVGLILLIQAFFFQTAASKVLGFITFFFFLFAGYLLIKTTWREIHGKEEAEKLAKELEGFNQNLEEKVKERTMDLETSYQEIKTRKEDLERFYNLAVGRELKMTELKKEISGMRDRKVDVIKPGNQNK